MQYEYQVFHEIWTATHPGQAREGEAWSSDHQGVVDAQDTNEALSTIWDRHNRDDRPDGQTAPSLSVGDLIWIAGEGFFKVERIGFTKIDAAEAEQDIDYRPYLEVIGVK